MTMELSLDYLVQQDDALSFTNDLDILSANDLTLGSVLECSSIGSPSIVRSGDIHHGTDCKDSEAEPEFYPGVDLYLECKEDDRYEMPLTATCNETSTKHLGNDDDDDDDDDAIMKPLKGKKTAWTGYSCPKCAKNYRMKFSILNHLANNHGFKKLFSCHLCSYQGSRCHFFIKHWKRCHPTHELEFPSLDKLGSLQDDCDSDYDFQNNQVSMSHVTRLRSHAESQDVEVPQPDALLLSGCNSNYQNNSSKNQPQSVILQDYKATKSSAGKSFHKCTFNSCNKSFAKSSYLKSHMNIHLANFKCTEVDCGKNFRDQYNLDIHKCTHSGEKQIKCVKCDYRCSQVAALSYHMKTKHSKELMP